MEVTFTDGVGNAYEKDCDITMKDAEGSPGDCVSHELELGKS